MAAGARRPLGKPGTVRRRAFACPPFSTDRSCITGRRLGLHCQSTGYVPVLGRVSWPLLALGVYGLFGFHFLLFISLRLAPPVEANLVNYLWPLGIVVMAPLFLNEGTLAMALWHCSVDWFFGRRDRHFVARHHRT